MDIKEYENFYHVDLSTQISRWKDDSVLAVVKNLRKYSVMIKARDKEEIKRRFIVDSKERAEKRHNRKIIAIIYSYG